MFKIFKEAMSIDAKKKGGDEKEPKIKYGEWKYTNNESSVVEV